MPKSLNEIENNKQLCTALQRAVSCGGVSHAYIFVCPDETLLCEISEGFCRSLLCESPLDGLPCGHCRACVKTAVSGHPDIIFVSGGGKNGAVLIESIRNLKSDIYIRPSEAERKIYIISGAETMNTAAQNALLKSLEEPPPYGVIILLCKDIGSLLPTIVSRSVVLNLESEKPSDEAAFALAKEIVIKSHSGRLYDLLPISKKLSDPQFFMKVADEIAEILLECAKSLEGGKTSALAKEVLQAAPNLTKKSAIAIIDSMKKARYAAGINAFSLVPLNFLINCWEDANC